MPNGTYGGVRGRRLITASYSIFSTKLPSLRYQFTAGTVPLIAVDVSPKVRCLRTVGLNPLGIGLIGVIVSAFGLAFAIVGYIGKEK